MRTWEDTAPPTEMYGNETNDILAVLPDWGDGCGSFDRRSDGARRLVCGLAKALVQSTKLGIWAGLDPTVYGCRLCWLASVAAGEPEDLATALDAANWIEPFMVPCLFRSPDAEVSAVDHRHVAGNNFRI